MAGYTRQSIADIINGSEVTAPPLNAEFNQMAAAFAAATGHSHDGSAGNAPKIDLTTSVAGYLPAIHGGIGGKNNFTATANPTLTDDSTEGYAVGSMWENTSTGRIFICVGNTGGAAVWRELVQVQTGNKIIPEVTDTVDLGEPSTRFQDLWLSGGLSATGNASVGGTLTVTGSTALNGGATTSNLTATSITVSGGTMDGTVIGGTTPQAVTGTTVVATTGFTGNLSGNVSGNLTGNVTGDVTGDVTGNLTGDVTSSGTSTFNNVTIDGTLNMNSGTTATITNLTTPVNPADAATKGYVDTSVAGLIDSAPGTLDTLNELAAALGNDPDFATTITNSIATKLPLAGGTMTGAIAMSTNKITGVGDPTAAQDVSSKAYTDQQDALQVTKSGDSMSGNLAMGSNNITGLATPTANDHASNKSYVDNILGSATSAAASAAAAASSQSSASTSEANAASSATSAASSATSANNSKNAAASSETAASASASAASTSETNAAASETAAAASETAAAASETAAATSETNAATSETNAATSETNASTSASSASTSASNAATSATAASTAQTAAESARDATLAAYDNFDDRYLGAKSSTPTVDNDGNALVAGSLYFDTVSGSMKVYTGSAWVAAYVSGTDYLPFSGGTMTGDVAHGDNVKATFGASADLEIYHDGSNSYIDGTGTGGLIIRAENNLYLKRTNSNETYLRGLVNDSVTLYHNGSEKLTTTSTGIDVTGRIDADDVIAVEGSSPRLQVKDTDGTNQFSFLQQQGSDVFLRARNDTVDGRIVFAGYGGGSTTNRLDINSSGDVRFWDETGASAKLVWDTSEEALEFGDNVKATFGAGSDLQVYHDGSNSYIQDAGTGNLFVQASNVLWLRDASGTAYFSGTSGNEVALYHNGSEKLSTTSTGIAVTGSVDFGNWTITESGGSLYFATGGTNKMKLDASGNLDVVGSVNSNATIT